MTELSAHHHGKSKVRLGRVWRERNEHHFVEWMVDCMVDSDMEAAFLEGDNTGMTATDTQKNTVYAVAKKISQRCTVEQYAIALAQHYVQTYPRISKAKIVVQQSPWRRVTVEGVPHQHGYEFSGTEKRTVHVVYDKKGKLDVTGGVTDLKLLKTTQSGYEGFIHDSNTTLPDTKERMMASSIAATWKFTKQPFDYDATFQTIKTTLYDAFFGPPKTGVYSPSVQYTLYQMGALVLARVPQVDSIFLNMPNIHFLPCTPPGCTFDNDVYVATSEPHGNIEAVVTRKGGMPHISKL